MHICNFRRLRDVRIELDKETSIFVGANNSGKTSATEAVACFFHGSVHKFDMFDFSAACWTDIDVAGQPNPGDVPPALPEITLDLWFTVASADLHLVIPLLPSTEWQGTAVGLRISFAARNPVELVKRYHQVAETARAQAAQLKKREDEKYVPWPKSLTDFLRTELHKEYELRYFVLDQGRFNSDHKPQSGYIPVALNGEPRGPSLLRSLMSVSTLAAQRHLADPYSYSGNSSGRSEDLSRRLSRFYERNLDQRKDDHNALRALFDSETGLNAHLEHVFKDMLARLADLGYPGAGNPIIEIRSALNPVTIMSTQDAQVHYVLGNKDSGLRLPDTHNGLGFKNLIYMVVEILDLHAQWVALKDARPPLHIIFIEEPEAHLHAQLQQVFIRNVLKLINEEMEGEVDYTTQIVVTTHSPHIVYESGFKPVRYFRRQLDGREQTTKVLNLSAFYQDNQTDSEFLQRYLKLTHCDLFFADAAILVEGNVERLLLPAMIEKSAAKLQSACLSVLEVGGAFAHRFQKLLEFLGINALIITDLDSVLPATDQDEDDDDDVSEFTVPGEEAPKRGSSCLPSVPGCLTSNQTLMQWLPKLQTVAELTAATSDKKIQEHGAPGAFAIRVTYQSPTSVTWNGSTEVLCGRTLEESFALENTAWCQDMAQKDLRLRIHRIPSSPGALAEKIHKRVSSSSFDKTGFALHLLTRSPEGWHVPAYIAEGLKWLEETVKLDLPNPLSATGPTSTLQGSQDTSPEVAS